MQFDLLVELQVYVLGLWLGAWAGVSKLLDGGSFLFQELGQRVVASGFGACCGGRVKLQEGKGRTPNKHCAF